MSMPGGSIWIVCAYVAFPHSLHSLLCYEPCHDFQTWKQGWHNFNHIFFYQLQECSQHALAQKSWHHCLVWSHIPCIKGVNINKRMWQLHMLLLPCGTFLSLGEQAHLEPFKMKMHPDACHPCACEFTLHIMEELNVCTSTELTINNLLPWGWGRW